MVQEQQVLKCCTCSTYQVHIVKKARKWDCKICNQRQSIKEVFGRGSGKDCRIHVQKLNALKATKEGNTLTDDQFSAFLAANLATTSTNRVETANTQPTCNNRSNKWEKYLEKDPEDNNDSEEDNRHLLERPAHQKRKRKKCNESESLENKASYSKSKDNVFGKKLRVQETERSVIGSPIEDSYKDYFLHGKKSIETNNISVQEYNKHSSSHTDYLAQNGGREISKGFEAHNSCMKSNAKLTEHIPGSSCSFLQEDTREGSTSKHLSSNSRVSNRYQNTNYINSSSKWSKYLTTSENDCETDEQASESNFEDNYEDNSFVEQKSAENENPISFCSNNASKHLSSSSSRVSNKFQNTNSTNSSSKRSKYLTTSENDCETDEQASESNVEDNYEDGSFVEQKSAENEKPILFCSNNANSSTPTVTAERNVSENLQNENIELYHCVESFVNRKPKERFDFLQDVMNIQNDTSVSKDKSMSGIKSNENLDFLQNVLNFDSDLSDSSATKENSYPHKIEGNLALEKSTSKKSMENQQSNSPVEKRECSLFEEPDDQLLDQMLGDF